MELIGWVLLGRDGHLRAGWRLLAHLILFVVAFGIVMGGAILVVLVSGWLAPGWSPDQVLSLTIQGVVSWALMMVVIALSAWFLDARFKGGFRVGRLRGVGQGGPPLRSVVEIVVGLALGTGGLLVAVAIMALGGMEASFEWPTIHGVSAWLLMGLGLIFAAWFEELLFRGYVFQWLGGSLQRLLQWAAKLANADTTAVRTATSGLAFMAPTVILSVLFGAAHLDNPSATAFSTINTVLAGVWFCVLVLRQGSLWAAVSAHWSWNAVMLLGLGLPVSGLGPESGLEVMSLVHLTATGPEWLSGGAYGPEGSVGSTVALAILITVSALLPSRGRSKGLVAAYSVQDQVVG